MHVAKSAKSLNLHANSLGYRLDRWRKLTGWDPRTFEGLRRSVAAVAAVKSAGKHGGAVELLDEP
jgi:sugar diacid utilization regulator